jgi:hypothetical protein
MQVHIVKSGQLIDFVGWEWENLKVFSNYDNAQKYHDKILEQIKNEDIEGVEIETLTLEDSL